MQNVERRPIRSVETRGGPVHLFDGGVILWAIPAGTILDERAADSVVSAVSELTEGVRFSIIGDARELGFANWGARDALASSDFEGRVATAAVVSSRVVRWLAEQYVRRVSSQRLIRMFNAIDDAFDWAEEQVRIAGEA